MKDPALYERMGFTSIDPDGRVLQERVEADARYYLARGFSQQAIAGGNPVQGLIMFRSSVFGSLISTPGSLDNLSTMLSVSSILT